MVLFLDICAGASQEHLNLKHIGFPLNIAVLLVGPSDEESPHPLRSLLLLLLLLSCFSRVRLCATP